MNIDDYEKAETTNIDYKLDLEAKKPKSWLKSVSAFANTKGGILLFGFDDKTHKCCGLKDVVKVAEKITELINTRITPLPRYEINCYTEDGRDYIEVQIGDGPITPYYYESDGHKEAFIRSGNQSIPAPKHILDNLILKGNNTSFDALTSRYNKNDLSFTLMNATVKEKTGISFNQERDYVSFGLVDKKGKLTNAAVLLSDQGALKQSKIICTRWNGIVKGSVIEDALDDKEYTGSLISLLENADTFIKNNSKSGWKIQGMYRIELEDYPTTARREAIVNALIHRDYQIIGSEIHIDMYDDRLEIVSPGGMMDGSLIQNLEISKVPSMRRNTIISDIFSRLHFMDRRGSGLSRIIESYNDCINKPKFISNESSFSVIFPNKGFKSDLKIKHPIENGNVVSDDDYFFIKLYKSLDGKVNNNTMKKINTLFNKCKFEKSFNREIIKEIFEVKNSRASEIISILLENNLIEKQEGSNYLFIK